MRKKLNIGLLGQGFMGRAHSAAWIKVNKFCNTEYEPVLKVVAGIIPAVEPFSRDWGFEEFSYDWRSVVDRKDIDIIDIVTPTFNHAEMAIAACRAGKPFICEKPCATTYADAKKMADEANKEGVTHYLNHNYRRVPAVAIAKELIDEGRLGEIYHWRGSYLQDWIMDPDFPLTWHFKKDQAGGGPLFDLGSHAVDLALYLIGDIKTVTAKLKTFITERPDPEKEGKVKGKVEIDDAAFMMIEFENGALGSIDTSRFASGRKNENSFEIYGSKGAITFNFERMNELNFLDLTVSKYEQGFKKILATEMIHPYAGLWWGPGHVLGYDHTFIHAFGDFLKAVAKNEKMEPNLNDGKKTIRVLEAAALSDKLDRSVDINEIK